MKSVLMDFFRIVLFSVKFSIDFICVFIPIFVFTFLVFNILNKKCKYYFNLFIQKKFHTVWFISFVLRTMLSHVNDEYYSYHLIYLVILSGIVSLVFNISSKLYVCSLDKYLKILFKRSKSTEELYSKSLIFFEKEYIGKSEDYDNFINFIIKNYSIFDIDFLKNTLKKYIDNIISMMYAYILSFIFLIIPLIFMFVIEELGYGSKKMEIVRIFFSQEYTLFFTISISFLFLFCIIFVIFHYISNSFILLFNDYFISFGVYNLLEFTYYEKQKRIELLENQKYKRVENLENEEQKKSKCSEKELNKNSTNFTTNINEKNILFK